MAVRRGHRPKGARFTNMLNDVIEDSRLSYRALGMLAYLLSKPEDWVIREAELAKAHGCGRDAVYSRLMSLRLAWRPCPRAHS